MKQLLTIFLLVLLTTGLQAKKNKYHERYYQTILCTQLGGVMEQSLLDRTRVDCLTTNFAIEVDFAKKWAESIGQSLYYAEMTNRLPAVGLIVRKTKTDQRHLKRLRVIADKYGITIFVIRRK